MKKESVKLYKVLSIILLFINIGIGLTDYKSLRTENILKKQKNAIKRPQIALKSYGFGDALEVIAKEPGLETVNLNMDAADKKILKVETKCQGSLVELRGILDKIKKEGNFYNINNIRIDNLNGKDQNISFDLYLIKNK